MGKVLKFFGWLLGLLVVLVLALVILVPLFVNPNDHKDQIVDEVKKATGRDLAINGDIGLSVFPWLGLELNGLKLSNAPGFGKQPFAAVDYAQVRVNLIPLLLHQTLEVDTIQLKGLELNLQKAKNGATNWDDLAGGSAKGGEASTEGPSGGGLTGFSIGGVDIQNGQVVWNDQSTGTHYAIKDLQVETGPLEPGKPVDVRLGLGLTSRKPPLQGAIELTGTLNANPRDKHFSLENLLLVVKVTGDGLPKEGVDAKLHTDLYVDQGAGTFEVRGLTIDSGELALSGDLQGVGLQNDPVVEGELRLNEFNPRAWMRRFELPVPETADPEVLKKLAFSTAIKGSASSIKFNNLVLRLDDSQLKGTAELLNTAKPVYQFNLDLNQINLDRYLPPAGEAKAAKQPAAPRREGPLFPVKLLRGLNLDGSLRVNSLTANKIHAQAIVIQIKSQNGKLRVNEQVGRFYDGLIKGDLTLDVHGKTPRLKIAQKASRILAGPLLQDLASTDKLQGSGDFSANLSTLGNTVGQLKRTLNGSLKFNFHDGAVKGFNLAKMIREAKAKLSGQNVPIANEPNQTDFSQLSGSARVRNGILSNQDLLAKSPFLRVTGAGKVNLVMENLDYTVKPVIVSTPKGQGGEGLNQLVGIPIPVHLTGPWADPKWNIDLAKVLQEQQKAKLKKEVDKKLKKKLPGLKDKLPGALKGLF